MVGARVTSVTLVTPFPHEVAHTFFFTTRSKGFGVTSCHHVTVDPPHDLPDFAEALRIARRRERFIVNEASKKRA
jgi:hypothetical protein